MPPLTLYLHTPFCLRKCPYCDFGSSVLATVPEERYLKSVKRELVLRRQQLANDKRPLIAIFLGGGTPSLLKTATIAGFLEQILALWPVEATCEITLEANPESVTLEKMRDWRKMGINRLSLGIQAFNPARLQFLQRPHDLHAGRRAIRQARQAGFDNLNLDLIYATPGHTPRAWHKELAEAMAWGPQHLSCYQLSIEPGTPFFQRSQDPSWVPVDEEMEVTLFQQTWETLAQGGWSGYEISNFAQSIPQSSNTSPRGRWVNGTLKFACRHNLNYWSFGDYLGIGCGAHGKFSTIMDSHRIIQVWRSFNPKTPETYMATMETEGAIRQAMQSSSAKEAGRECLLMGLRHDGGVQRTLYQHLTGEDLVQCRAKSVTHLVEAGYLTVGPERLCLTKKGIPLADAIILALL